MHVLDPASALPSILFILLLDIMVSPETENVVPYKIHGHKLSGTDLNLTFCWLEEEEALEVHAV